MRRDGAGPDGGDDVVVRVRRAAPCACAAPPRRRVGGRPRATGRRRRCRPGPRRRPVRAAPRGRSAGLGPDRTGPRTRRRRIRRRGAPRCRARSLRARCARPARSAPWSVRSDTASSSPSARTEPRTCSMAASSSGGHDAGVGVEVVVEEAHRPRGVGRPRPARRRGARPRDPRRTRPGPRPSSATLGVPDGEVRRVARPTGRRPAPPLLPIDTASHRLAGTRRRPGPAHDGGRREPRHDVVARPVRGGQIEQAEHRGSGHRSGRVVASPVR